MSCIRLTRPSWHVFSMALVFIGVPRQRTVCSKNPPLIQLLVSCAVGMKVYFVHMLVSWFLIISYHREWILYEYPIRLADYVYPFNVNSVLQPCLIAVGYPVFTSSQNLVRPKQPYWKGLSSRILRALSTIIRKTFWTTWWPNYPWDKH
jgi:hypothetical protein